MVSRVYVVSRADLVPKAHFGVDFSPYMYVDL